MATSYQKKGLARLDNINIQAKNRSIAFRKMIFKEIRSVKILK